MSDFRHPSYRLWSSLLSVALASGVALEAQRPSFRTGVDLVLLNVSVTAPGGRHVSGLSADDFDLFEDGRPQAVSFFSPANPALSISLLLDTSSSMEENLPLAQRAAMDFVAKLRPGDMAEVVDFDSRVEVLQPFTSDRSLLESAIERMRAGGSTALYNAVYIALKQLEKVRPQAGDDFRREVIVVLSDGEDTSSLVGFDELLDVAKRSQTAIYTIGLGLEPASSGIRQQTGEFVLRRLAQETGGQLFMAKQPSELSNVYTKIADDLTSQYVLGYLSSNVRRDGGWRNLAVRVHRPNLQARTRTGYYAPSSR
jgi:Ca-activated chloride channel family protein